MNELLLLGGGTLAAYLWLRHSNAHAALAPAAPGTQSAAGQPAAGKTPPPSTPTAPSSPPSTKPPQTPSAPSASSEVAPNRSYLVQLTGRWGWPVPRWQGRAPVISDGYGSTRPGATHLGVDLMFARIASDAFPTTGTNGTKLFVMPDSWPAVAAADGVLWSAGPTLRGYAVVVDHGTVATFYQHLSTLIVPEIHAPAPGTPRTKMIPIQAGQPLGIIGGDPSTPPYLKHLHFELWPVGPASAVDPQPYMRTWQIFTPDDVAPMLASLTRNAANRAPSVPSSSRSARMSGAGPARRFSRRADRAASR